MTPRTRYLAVTATLFAGLLAGLTADRALVQMPAWSHIGVASWTTYMRTVNGEAGWILYPSIGLLALLATIATAVAVRLDGALRSAPRLRLIAYLAAGVSIMGAIVTRAATVPLMTRVMSGASDAVFTSLNGWWMLNDALHTAAFVCNLSVLAMLSISVSKTD